MSENVNYGIIGCGMMGREHIQNIMLLPGARVAAVMDPVVELAKGAAAMAGGAVPYTDLDDLLGHEPLDALVIVSPNFLHVPHLAEIARVRSLPVLCEKPLFTDPADAARVREMAANWPHPFWVAMEYRYMPPIAALVTQAEQATGGISMLTIREHRFPFLPKIGNWNRFNAKTGGTLVEKCCHFFDLMRLILKDEPIRVMASAGQTLNHRDESYEGQVPDVWDNGYVLLDFARGARAMLDLCMFAEGSRWQEEICAVGPKGKIECFVPGPGRFWPQALGPAPTPELVISPRAPKGPFVSEIPVDPTLLEAGDHNGATFYQHQRFLTAIRGQGAVEVTAEDGARAVEIGQAAQKSAETGQAVLL